MDLEKKQASHSNRKGKHSFNRNNSKKMSLGEFRGNPNKMEVEKKHSLENRVWALESDNETLKQKIQLMQCKINDQDFLLADAVTQFNRLVRLCEDLIRGHQKEQNYAVPHSELSPAFFDQGQQGYYNVHPPVYENYQEIAPHPDAFWDSSNGGTNAEYN